MHNHFKAILVSCAVFSCAVAALAGPPDTIVVSGDTPVIYINSSVGIFVDTGTSRTIAAVSSRRAV